MFDLVLTLTMKFWQWTVLIAVVIIVNLINLLDKKKKNYNFSYDELPTLKPVAIPTKGKGFWKGIVMWLLSTRNWELTKDWHYTIDGEYVILAGFVFDGASIPKFLRTFFSPVGVLLVGGLVHDYAYKYETLLMENKTDTILLVSQKRADEIFRDININVNGFYVMNYLAYYSLKIRWFCCVEWTQKKKRKD